MVLTETDFTKHYIPRNIVVLESFAVVSRHGNARPDPHSNFLIHLVHLTSESQMHLSVPETLSSFRWPSYLHLYLSACCVLIGILG